jgi:outer membrane biosynthesis protein TonB
MKNIFTAILFLSFAFGFGQDTSAPKEAAKLIKEKSNDASVNFSQDITVNAIPKEGIKAFREKIEKSFRLPDVTERTEGTVIVKFIVWEDGSLRDFQIVKETPDSLGLANEFIRLLKRSKKWLPGIHNGKISKQYFTLPMSFVIMPSKKVVQPVKENVPTPKKD